MPFYGEVDTLNNGRVTNSRKVNGETCLFTMEGVDFEFLDQGFTGEIVVRQIPQGYGRVETEEGREFSDEEYELMVQNAMDSNPPVEIGRYDLGPIGVVWKNITVPDFNSRQIRLRVIRLPV